MLIGVSKGVETGAGSGGEGVTLRDSHRRAYASASGRKARRHKSLFERADTTTCKSSTNKYSIHLCGK